MASEAELDWEESYKEPRFRIEEVKALGYAFWIDSHEVHTTKPLITGVEDIDYGSLEVYVQGLEEFGIRDIILPINWGFSEEHFYRRLESVCRLLPTFEEAGIKVDIYHQLTNSHIDAVPERYFAKRPDGGKYPYHSKRYVTCPSTDWKDDFLFKRLGIVLDRLDSEGFIGKPVRGIFGDNAVGSAIIPPPTGKALPRMPFNCFCEACQYKYAEIWQGASPELEESFLSVPEIIIRDHLNFRASIMTSMLIQFADRVHQKNMYLMERSIQCVLV